MSHDGERILLDAVHQLADTLPQDVISAIRHAIVRCADRDWRGRRSAVVQAVSHPRTRDMAERLVVAWEAHAPGLSAEAMGVALQSATLQAARRRDATSLELVWTGPESREMALRQTSQALLDVIRAAREQLTVVSFAVTRIPAIEAALIGAAARLRSVRLVAESPIESAGQLSSSAAAHLHAASHGRIQLFSWPLERRPINQGGRPAVLHAKCGVADDHLLFVSSANLTDAALGLNMELGVLVRGGDAPGKVRRHFDVLIEDCHLVRVTGGG